MRDREWSKTDELLQAGEKNEFRFSKTAGPCQGSKKLEEKKGQKRRITRKECRRLWNVFETGGFIPQEGLWNVAREKMLQDRGALPSEEGDIVREYKAMHEENF